MTFAAETVEAAEASVTFTFAQGGVTASAEGSGYEIDGTTLNITASGTYKITGSCSEGSIAVAKGLDSVTLILENASIGSSTTAPIVVKKGSNVVLQVNGTNTLTDSEDASTEDTNADFEGAGIKVKSGSSLTVTGSGTLNIDAASCKNGIKGAATATVTVNSSTLNINAANTGIASDGEVVINGGNINITAANDGIKSEPDDTDTESKGVVTINGGNLNLNVTTADSSDAIWGYNEANVLGGNITITAGDDAIHSEYVTNIGTQGGSGPVINVKSCVEGIEGATVNLYSGSADITSSDDGINAANGDLTGYSYSVNIYGGTWNVNAGGDAIDSNGDLNVSGGESYVFSGTAMDNGGLDFDGKCNVTGGKLLAVGMSGMAQVPTSGTYVAFSNVNIKTGSSVEIKDASGNTVVSFTGKKNLNHVVYAGDGLTSGQTYTIFIDGSQAGSVTTNSAKGGMQGGMMPGGQPGEQTQNNQQGQNGQQNQNMTPPDQNGQNMTPPDQNGQNMTPPGQNGQRPQRQSDMQNNQDGQTGQNAQNTQNAQNGQGPQNQQQTQSSTDSDKKEDTNTDTKTDTNKNTGNTSAADTTKKTGWYYNKELGGYQYYGTDGKAYTGWHYMTSKEGEKTDHWSYFGSDGKIYTGWHYMTSKEGEKTDHWSYFGTNGWLRTGWQELGQGTSNPDGNATRHTSYFGNNGWLVTGSVNIGGKNYSFDSKGWLK